MKKLTYIILFSLLSTQLFASHGMGGEITWICSGNSYIFKVKFYRDCTGIPGMPSVSLDNNAGVPSIFCSLVSQSDISPIGSAGSGNIPCPTCAAGNTNAVEEFVYQSAPIALPGIPPASGWAFSFGTCCRSGLLTNIPGAGGIGFSLRAKMYPYAGFVAGQCKDVSPFFAEKPSTIICTGYPFTYNHNAIDQELDSLVYTWDSPITDAAYPWAIVPFGPGYSVNSQMPSTIQNLSNVPAAINPITGEITYTSFTPGYFATVTKVSAYKCGILAAEIWREINVVLINGCVIPVAGNPANNPPIPTPPFPDPITGFPNQSYNTIAYAGDTIRFSLPATDPDPHPVLGVQSVTFNASGGEFGAGFINPNAGCFIPPCATLNPAPPVTSIFGNMVQFVWPVKCQHMGVDTNCTRISNVYNFVLRINDNYCPANGIRVATISVTVKRPPKLLPPRLKCVSVLNTAGDVELSWAPPAPRDTHYTFSQYEIWASLNAGGPFFKLDSVYGGLNKYYETGLVIPAAKQVAVLGTHAQNQSIYFQMYTRCGCDSDSLSVASNLARSMKANAVQAGTSVDVTWNAVHNPLLATSHTKYYIYKEFPIGTWSATPIDSTTHPDFNFTDLTTNSICDDSVTYRIQTGDDSLLCTSWSSFAGVHVINAAPVSVIAPNNPFVCSGGNVILTANAGGTAYQWSPGGQTTQSISASSSGVYTVTITYVGGCTSDTFTTVTVCTPGTCQLNLTGATAICPGSSTTLSITGTPITPGTCPVGGPPYTYSYLDVTNNIVHGPFVTNTLPITFSVSPASTTTYQLLSLSLTGAICPSSIIGPPITVTVLPIPTATIAGTPSICNGQCANLMVNFAGGPGPYNFTYNPGGIVVNGVNNPAVINVCPTSTTNYTLVSVSNANCPGNVAGTATVTVNPLPTAQLNGTQTICAGQTANLNINFTGTGPWTYSYLAGATLVGPFVSPVSPAVISVSPGATTTYSLPPNVSDANCAGTNTAGNATVTVNPLPTAQILGNATICAGASTNLVINFTGVAPFTYSYTNGSVISGPFTTNNNSVTIPVSPLVTTTYTLSGSVTGAGCNGAVGGSATITVNQLPTASITGSNTICDGTATILSLAFANAPGPYTYSYTANATSFGPFTTSSNPAVISVSPNVNTTYTITSISNTNCTGSVIGVAALVTVTPLPTATLAGTTDICIGQSTNLNITFTGQAPYTYSYLAGATLNGPFISNTNSATISVNPIIITNYTLTNTVIGNGCNGATAGSALITVNTLPTALINGNPTICAGDQTNLEISFTGTAPYTYRYSDGVSTFGPFTTSNNPEIITVSPPVTRTFTVTAVNDANCNGITNGQSLVTVNPLPTAQIIGNATICNGDQTNLTINFTGTAPFVYSYSDGASTIGPLNTNNNSVIIPVNPVVNTTYTVTAVDDNNCTGTVNGSVLVTVNQLPTAVLAGSPVICNGQTANLAVTFTGTAPFVFSYTDGTNIFGPITTFNNPYTLTVSPTANTIYGMSGNVTGAGCIGATAGSASVTVNQLPTATVAGTPEICTGDQTTFDIAFTGAPPFTYSYTNGASTFGPFTTPNLIETITVSPTATTTYSVNVVSDDNCTGTFSGQAVVTVHPLPTAQISGTTGICFGNSTNLSINFTGTGPYTYTYFDGNTPFGPFTTSNDPEMIIVQPNSNTTYTVTSVSDANCTGTSVTGTATITVHPIPDAVISDVTSICVGASSSFKITFTGTAPFTYRYTDGSSTFGPFNTSNNLEVITVSPTSTENYELVSMNDAYCNGTYSGLATVNVNDLPTPVITGTNVICNGDNTTFDAGAGYTAYLWSNNSQTTQSISIGTAGNYTVTVTDLNGCVNWDSEILTVNETPDASFTNDTSLTCEAPIINFINTSTYPAGSQFQWDFGDASGSDQENPSHLYALPGTYPITLIITTTEGCADTLVEDVDIQFYPLAEAAFNLDPATTGIFNSTISFADQSLHAETWHWDFGDGQQSTEPNPKHFYDEIGKFKVVLTVTNIAACPDRYEQEVLITPFYIPNAFTPNGDGMNDKFFETGYVTDVSAYNMNIFSRWGQKVFENDDYRKFWNGLDKNGKPLAEGVYVYSIQVKTKSGKPYEYQGTVTLMR
ncbi:MAG: PKD domain-containing protein [Bacteroidia bacterium]